MKTDISLRSPTRTIIIETKYYSKTLQEYFGHKSVKSENLYQLFSYLTNLGQRGGADGLAEGVLLYPAIEEKLDLKYVIQGHSVRIRTLNLAQDWQSVRDDLLSVLEDEP